MVQLVASVLAFAAGLFFLPTMFRGMRVKDSGSAIKSGLLGGVLSVGLGKVLLTVLSLVFLPIVLLGPVGAFLVQAIVNIVLLNVLHRMGNGIEFDRMRTTLWAAIALTVLQILIRFIV